MPYVQSDNAKLAQRINSLIYLHMLELPAPAKLQDGLKEQKTEEGVRPPSDLSFEVGRNDERILALSVSAEGCGAYCENYTVYFNFDATTGRHMTSSDIFTPAGSAKLLKQLDAMRLVRVKAEIVRLRNDAKAAQAAKSTTKGKVPAREEDTYFDDAITMYEQCVASRTDPEWAKYRNLESDKMKISKDAVTFIREQCSNHALRALDDVGNIANPFSLKDLAPHLSEYGKALLLGEGKTAPASGPYNQVLIGKVGQAPITLRLGARNADNSLSATYYYNKFRKPIQLFGTVTGNVLELEESDSSSKVLAVIRATISGESLSGYWIGNSRQIAFEAGP